MTYDPYTDPATGVLRDRLGITDAAKLADAEADYSAVRAAHLGHLPGAYDLAHLQAFHARLFGDLYDWAGELRTVGTDKGVPFCPPEHLVPFATDVLRRLAADDHLREREREDCLPRIPRGRRRSLALHGTDRSTSWSPWGRPTSAAPCSGARWSRRSATAGGWCS